MVNCVNCGKNLALVGKVHRCPVPTAAIGGHTKVTYAANERFEIVEIHQPVGAILPLSAAKTLGSLGGKSKSPAKQAASRANGKKGGKPKRNPSA
jgi:hypothetical protein